MDTFAARDAQLLEEAWQTGIQRTFAEAAGFLRQRTGEPGFADAGGTGDQQRLTALDPFAMTKASDESGVESTAGAGVEILQAGLAVFEPSLG